MRKKTHLLKPVFAIGFLIFTNNIMTAAPVEDSVKILHVTDGNITEWQKEKFATDRETGILYAVDHDAKNLHLALKIPNQRTQMKMMTMGMNMFIDKKGKRREGTGIEFPFKNNNDLRSGGDFDPKVMREKLVTGMIFLRTFGFDEEDKTQVIAQENGVNIAFNWDEADVMYIEYQIPISLLGKTEDLNGKQIAVGWKINAPSENTARPTVVRTELVAVPAGTRPGSSNSRPGGSSSSTRSADMGAANVPREQSFWTKYNLIF